MDLRQRVEVAARRAGLGSQRRLAEAIGVTQPSIHALLSGRFPMDDVLDRLADAVGVAAVWLRFGAETDAPEWAHDIYRIELGITTLEQQLARATKPEERRTLNSRLTQARLQLDDRLGARRGRRGASTPGDGLDIPAVVAAELDRLRRRVADQAATIRELTRQVAEHPVAQPPAHPRGAGRTRRTRPPTTRSRARK